MRTQVSAWQVLLIVFILSLCVTPFEVPGLLMPRLGVRAAWWGELPALGAALWGVAAAGALARRFHGRSLDRTVLALLGPTLGYPYLAVLAVLFFGGVPGCLFMFSGAAHAELLPRLPVAFVAVMVAGVGTYAARSGPESVARCAEALVPLLAVGLLSIYLPPLFNAQFGRLLPLRPPPLSDWLSPQVLGATATIRGFLPLLVLGPLATPPPRWRGLAVAATLGWVLVLASLVLPVAIFDAPLSRVLSVPFLSAVATVSWRWLPLRSLVAITLLVWYVITVVVFATYLWMSAWLLERLVPRLPRVAPVLVLGAAAAVVASLPMTTAEFHALFVAWSTGVLILGLVVPTLLCLLAGRGAASGTTLGDASP